MNSFPRQSFAQQDNHYVSLLVSFKGSLVLHVKTLILLLSEIFRRTKVKNFSFGDENFSRQIVSPDKVSPDKVVALSPQNNKTVGASKVELGKTVASSL